MLSQKKNHKIRQKPTSKRQLFAIKFEMQKAYDEIEWPFLGKSYLILVLTKVGLSGLCFVFKPPPNVSLSMAKIMAISNLGEDKDKVTLCCHTSSFFALSAIKRN